MTAHAIGGIALGSVRESTTPFARPQPNYILSMTSTSISIVARTLVCDANAMIS